MGQPAIPEWNLSDAMVEEGNLPCQDLDWENGLRSKTLREDNKHSERVAESINSGYSDVPGLSLIPDKTIQRRLNIQQQLLESITSLLVVPIESSCQVRYWLEHPTLSIFNQSDPEYRRACSLFSRRLQHLSFTDIRLIHEEHPHALYLARSDDHYYTPEESLEAIETLLDYQYPNSQDKLAFITALFNVCERAIPKMNSLYLWGPANCGKSYFMDMVTSFYINVGHVKNFVRGQNFPLNDCVARRILLWNEPSIMPSAFDSVKMLAGGDPCPCAVKYEGDGKISRTPLLFTANKTTFNQSDVWTTRVATFRWESCPPLKHYTKYPHPYTFALLIDKFYQ
nr:MAG: nonstructural protein NS1 [Bee densovirus 3]